MPKVEFNRRITLQKRGTAAGSSGLEIKSTKTVWGCVEDTSLSFKTDADRSGLAPSLFVHLWRGEFEKDSYNYCIIGQKEYRISMTGKSYNSQYVKLMLERS